MCVCVCVCACVRSRIGNPEKGLSLGVPDDL